MKFECLSLQSSPFKDRGTTDYESGIHILLSILFQWWQSKNVISNLSFLYLFLLLFHKFSSSPPEHNNREISWFLQPLYSYLNFYLLTYLSSISVYLTNETWFLFICLFLFEEERLIKQFLYWAHWKKMPSIWIIEPSYQHTPNCTATLHCIPSSSSWH